MAKSRKSSKRQDKPLQGITENINDRHKFYTDHTKLGYHNWVLSGDQQELNNLIDEKRVVFVSGRAGEGKTAGILYNFVKEYLKDKYKNIVIIRTPVEAGLDKIGALPNDLNAKIEPHFIPAKKILEELLYPEKVKADTGKRIHYKIPNFALGDTFNDSLIIISEAQQIAPEILKMLLERTGKNSTCVVEGDETQIYSQGKRNGLSDAISKFFYKDDDGVMQLNKPSYNDVGYFKFSGKTNMRDDIVSVINDAYS